MKAHFDPHIHSSGRHSTATESKRISLCVPSQREPEEKRRSVGAVEANNRGLRFNEKDYYVYIIYIYIHIYGNVGPYIIYHIHIIHKKDW